MRHFLALRLCWAILAVLASYPFRMAAAQDTLPFPERAQDVVEVLTGAEPGSAVFSESFLAEIPDAQLHKLVGQLTDQMGALQTAEELESIGPASARFKLRFERGYALADIQLQQTTPHYVTGFRISGGFVEEDTPETLTKAFEDLPGKASFGIYRLDGDRVLDELEYRGHAQMAIGSTFKLYVLSALASEVSSGALNWADVIELNARSLPSGMMQDWPSKAPVTLQTLASLMISISDNTATDTLIDVLGRQRVERELFNTRHSQPLRTLPLLKTAELFALKGHDAAFQASYIAADIEGRRSLIEHLQTDDLAAGDIDRIFGAGPVAPPIEWFASTRDIAHVFGHIRKTPDGRALKVLAINPNLSKPHSSPWSYIGYKGGSEPGVLNLSWLLRSQAGTWRVVSASWNNEADFLDQTRFEAMSRRLVGYASRLAD